MTARNIFADDEDRAAYLDLLARQGIKSFFDPASTGFDRYCEGLAVPLRIVAGLATPPTKNDGPRHYEALH